LEPEFRHGIASQKLACLNRFEEESMSIGTLLLIILIIILVGALPTWPYSAGWGYYPTGGVGLLLVIVVILLLMGRL
jgi:hypothetical protein